MATVMGVRHVLAVQDVARSSRWYQQALGFEEYFALDDDWRFLRLGRCIVMMGQCADEVPAAETGNHSYAGYWDVDDARSLFGLWTSRGVEVVKDLTDEPWGQREFGIRTPDGHRFMIGEEIGDA